MQLTEAVHKILSALVRENRLARSEATSSLIFGLTQAVAVQRGVLVVGSSRYQRQVQQVVGLDPAWARYHRLAIDADESDIPLAQATTIKLRAMEALRMDQQTVTLLRASIQPDHRPIVERAAFLIDNPIDLLRPGASQLLP